MLVLNFNKSIVISPFFWGCRIVFIFFLSSLSFSQTTFYLQPLSNSKNSISFIAKEETGGVKTGFFENDYFFGTHTVTYNARVVRRNSLNLGIGIGITLNESENLQFEWTQDKASFLINSNYRTYFNDYNYNVKITYHRAIHRVGLNYSKIRFTQDGKRKFLQYSFGCGAFLNFNQYSDVHVDQPTGNIYLTPTLQLSSLYIQPLKEKKINAYLKFGLEGDVRFRKKYFFTTSAFYIQGFGKIARIEHVHKYKQNGELFILPIGLESRGSGIYFQLSRRFQVYPIKKKVKLEK
jgi:hypothetical protein